MARAGDRMRGRQESGGGAIGASTAQSSPKEREISKKTKSCSIRGRAGERGRGSVAVVRKQGGGEKRKTKKRKKEGTTLNQDSNLQGTCGEKPVGGALLGDRGSVVKGKEKSISSAKRLRTALTSRTRRGESIKKGIRLGVTEKF